MHICLFDIDGTLLSSGGAGKAALEDALTEEFGIRGTMDKLMLSGRTDGAIVADLLRLSGLPDTPENRARLFAAYLRHLPASLTRCAGRVLPGVRALARDAAAQDQYRHRFAHGQYPRRREYQARPFRAERSLCLRRLRGWPPPP